GVALARRVRRREAVGQVVVVAAVERLEDALAVAGQAVADADAGGDVVLLEERRARHGRGTREDAAAVARLQRRRRVADFRLADAVLVADVLVIVPEPACQRQSIAERPAIL